MLGVDSLDAEMPRLCQSVIINTKLPELLTGVQNNRGIVGELCVVLKKTGTRLGTLKSFPSSQELKTRFKLVMNSTRLNRSDLTRLSWYGLQECVICC